MRKVNSFGRKRRSIRLKEYDYSEVGAYFVTICTRNQEMYFEQYPELKDIVQEQWNQLPEWFPNIELDEFVIMPNHIHGIILIIDKDSTVGAGLAPAPNSKATARVAPTLGEIIGVYKSICVTKWLKYIKQNNINAVGKFWQRNYYEHIIRNKYSLEQIQEYVHYNPLKWELDRENPNRKGINEFDKWLYKNSHMRMKATARVAPTK